MPTTLYPHIEIQPDGSALITGTCIKVIEIALDHLAHHWDAEEIQRQYPELNLGQIHSALGFYFDNHSELDQQIEARLARETQLLSVCSNSVLREKLRSHRQR